ncbi:MAG: hypothetical protein U1A78_17820 [Polyangia bacterium]
MRTHSTISNGWLSGKTVRGTLMMAAVLGLGGLAGGCGELPAEAAEDPAAVTQQGAALCTGCAPTPVTPPTASAWISVPTNGEVGNGASLTSASSPSGSFTGGFQGLIGQPNQIASIEPTSPPTSTDVCSRSGTSATVYAHSKSLGYWYVYGTMSKGGTWVPASGFIPAHCDLGAGLAVSGSDVDKVIIDGYSYFCWYGTCWNRQVREGVYWHY